MTEYQLQFEDIYSEINESFVGPLFKNKAHPHIEYGGAGSAKSYSIAQKMILRCLLATKRGYNHRLLCLRKTQPAARKSLYVLFEEILNKWGLHHLYKPNKSDMTITICENQIIYITGMDDPEKIKSIQGVSSIWMEEATEFTYDDYMQLMLRLRGKYGDYLQLIMSFNPIDENHWIKTELIDNGGISIHHSTIDDNKLGFPPGTPHGDQYRKLLDDLCGRDENYYRIYRLGEWGILKGLIYDNWDLCDDIPNQDRDYYGLGLDFGYSSDPAACVEINIFGNDIYLDEVLYETGLTNDVIARKLKMFLKHNPNSLIIADSAEPKSIQELCNEGLNCVGSIKGKDSVNNGIQRVKQYRLHITKRSVNLIKEIKAYKWEDDKKHEKMFMPKPVKFLDHLMDAMRYGITRMVGLARPGFTIMSEDYRADRLEYITSDNYDPVFDDELWEEY